MIRMWRSICRVRPNDSAFSDDLILRQRMGNTLGYLVEKTDL